MPTHQKLRWLNKKSYKEAEKVFQSLQEQHPANQMAAYYLGVLAQIANDNPEVIRQWTLYVRLDPLKAIKKDIPRHLSLLVLKERRNEIKKAMLQEKNLAKSKPVKNSIAVFPLKNLGDPVFSPLAVGLTSLIISDLYKVPGLRVLERQKINILLDELKLSKTGLVTKSSTVRSGNLLKAENIVVSDIVIGPIELFSGSK